MKGAISITNIAESQNFTLFRFKTSRLSSYRPLCIDPPPPPHTQTNDSEHNNVKEIMCVISVAEYQLSLRFALRQLSREVKMRSKEQYLWYTSNPTSFP